MLRKIRGLASVRNMFAGGTERVTVIDGTEFVILELGNSVNQAGLTVEQARILGDQLFTAAEILEKREKAQCQSTAPCETSKNKQPASGSISSGVTGGKGTGSAGR